MDADRLRRLGADVHLVWSFIAAAGFAVTLVVLDAIMDDFDPLKDTISAHAHGAGSKAITYAFIVAGLSLIPAGYPIQWFMRSRIARLLAMLLFAVGGLCIAALAFYPTDPTGELTHRGEVHLALAAGGISAVLLGSILGSITFARRPEWPVGGFVSSWISGIITGTFAVTAVILYVAANGNSSPADGALGLVERAVVFAELLWVTHMVARVRSVLYRAKGAKGRLVEGKGGLHVVPKNR